MCNKHRTSCKLFFLDEIVFTSCYLIRIFVTLCREPILYTQGNKIPDCQQKKKWREIYKQENDQAGQSGFSFILFKNPSDCIISVVIFVSFVSNFVIVIICSGWNAGKGRTSPPIQMFFTFTHGEKGL